MLLDRKPDLAIISEANILCSDQDFELFIPEYKLILPNTMQLLNNCRIAILAKEEMDIQVLNKYMNNDIASIWLKLSCKGKKTVNLGAIYREHQHIRQVEPNVSGSIFEQNKRWIKFTDQWAAASAKGDTIVIGDLEFRYE